MSKNLEIQTSNPFDYSQTFQEPDFNLLTTFLIPCFNGRSTIERAVRSALDSTVHDVEVIVVDDASTDGSVEVARAIVDSRVRVLPQTVNRGPSSCRNLGIEAAEGEWLAILDADDWVAPERLERLLSIATSAGLEMVADNQWVVNEQGEKIRQRFSSSNRLGVPNDQGFTLLDLATVIEKTGVGILQPLIRRQLLLDSTVRYRPNFKYGEDYHLVFDLVRAGARFGFVDEPLYYAELIEGSLTSNRVAMYGGMIDVLKSVREELSGNDASPLRARVDQAIANCRRTIVYGAVIDPLKERRFGKAFAALLKHPSFFTQLPGRFLRQFKRF